MPLIEKLHEELMAALRSLADLIEGVLDMQGALQRDGRSEALTVLNTVYTALITRKALIEAVLRDLRPLAENGYPEEVPITVEAAVKSVLAEQLRTQTLAYDKMTVPRDAVTASVVIGDPVPNE